MFVVTEEDEAAIRAVYEQRGEFAAALRAAAAVARHHRQRAGTGVRPGHRRLEAAAAAGGEAYAPRCRGEASGYLSSDCPYRRRASGVAT